MLNADHLPFSDIDSLQIEIESGQFWGHFRVKFEVNETVDAEGNLVCEVTVSQTELVNGKAFSREKLLEIGNNVFGEVIAKGFIIRFNPVVYLGMKKILPKFLLLEDPYNSISGRTFIFRTHFPKFIYELNRPDESSHNIQIDGTSYTITIHENLDEQTFFEVGHLKEVVSWYHYSG